MNDQHQLCECDGDSGDRERDLGESVEDGVEGVGTPTPVHQDAKISEVGAVAEGGVETTERAQVTACGGPRLGGKVPEHAGPGVDVHHLGDDWMVNNYLIRLKSDLIGWMMKCDLHRFLILRNVDLGAVVDGKSSEVRLVPQGEHCELW